MRSGKLLKPQSSSLLRLKSRRSGILAVVRPCTHDKGHLVQPHHGPMRCTCLPVSGLTTNLPEPDCVASAYATEVSSQATLEPCRKVRRRVSACKAKRVAWARPSLLSSEMVRAS